MKLVIHPAVDQARLTEITKAAGTMTIVNATDEPSAVLALSDANAFFGKKTFFGHFTYQNALKPI